MSEVNVLYCFDTKFWHMAAVALESLLTACRDETRVNVYCMVAPKTDGKLEFQKIIDKHKSGNKLFWREIPPRKNPFQSYEYSRWSPVIFYRCFAHKIFPNVEKMLYLDSDTLICRDISELFKTDLNGNTLGMVRDLAPIHDKYHPQGIYVKEFSRKYLNDGPYHNSGVLLLDLRKMAEHEHLLFETKIPLYYPDQDLLNAAFFGKIKTLPLKYNLAPGILVPRFFPENEAREALMGGHVIVHCYSVKPYDYDHAPDAIYNMFSKHAKSIGMDSTKFMEYEKKYTKHKIRKTVIPFVRAQNDTILFMGMKIKI